MVDALACASCLFSQHGKPGAVEVPVGNFLQQLTGLSSFAGTLQCSGQHVDVLDVASTWAGAEIGLPVMRDGTLIILLFESNQPQQLMVAFQLARIGVVGQSNRANSSAWASAAA